MNKRCKVKFCGMRDNPTLAFAVDIGADYIGFVIDFPKSPRSISREEFIRKAKWLRNNHDGNYKIVAVTVDMPLNNLEFIIENSMADVIQLHGKEHISICRLVSEQVETWKAINAKGEMSMEEINTFGKSVDKLLLDSGTALEKARNTSGAFDNMDLYNSLVKQGIDVVLSGGLDITNIEHYLNLLNPAIIDVSRGVESAPGVKAKQKMMEFMDKVNRFYSDERETDEEE
jgi:phosphoribosylanthranilate isomerase